MSGHSKWSTIKRDKASNDAKRANVFTKIGKIISIAAREGGGKPEANFKLKMVIDQARSVNMPKENIERAIKRGTGELKDGVDVEEVIYEAYLPTSKIGGQGNVAMLIKTATDNKNRTVGELKNILTKAGGKLVPAGSVNFLFKQVEAINIVIEKENNLDELEMKAIEAGAEDTSYSDGLLTVYTRVGDLQAIEEKLEKMGIITEGARLSFVSLQKIAISEDLKKDYENLLQLLDNQDDVQEVFDNLN